MHINKALDTGMLRRKIINTFLIKDCNVMLDYFIRVINPSKRNEISHSYQLDQSNTVF